MSMRALKDEFSVQRVMAPIASTATTTQTAQDMANVLANMFIIHPGLWTDGTHTPKLTESSDNTTFTDVAAADLVGSLAAITSTATAIIQKCSYIGKLRYVKPVITVATATVGAIIGMSWVLRMRKQPTT